MLAAMPPYLPQIALAMSMLIPIAGIICSYWFKAQKVRSENALKRAMVERGMSANEIVQVLAAEVTDPRICCG